MYSVLYAITNTQLCTSYMTYILTVIIIISYLYYILDVCVSQEADGPGSKAHYSVVELREGGCSSASGPSPSHSPDTLHRDLHDRGKVDDES